MSQLPDQHQGKLSKCKQLSYLHVAKHPFCFIKLIENKSRSNPTTFSAIYHEVTVLQHTVPEYTLSQLAWERSMLEWEVGHLRKCCQDLEREKAHVEGQLQQEKHKWFPRFLNAIGAKTNTPCEACRYQCSEVYLTQCFHLLCRECYQHQGPETPNAVANWTCKACAPFHFL